MRQIIDQALCISMDQAAEMLNLSRAKVYELADREGLPTVYFGKARKVPVEQLRAWLNARVEAQQSS